MVLKHIYLCQHTFPLDFLPSVAYFVEIVYCQVVWFDVNKQVKVSDVLESTKSESESESESASLKYGLGSDSSTLSDSSTASLVKVFIRQ